MNNYKNQYDIMTKTPVSSLIIKLGIPTTLSMLVTNIYNMVDTMFVGKLGTSASGAVGIVFGFMAIIQAFGFMYGQGAGSIVSRKLGARRLDDANRFASTGFFLSLFTGCIIGILSLIFLEPLMYLLGCTDTILPYAKTYVFFIILASPLMMSTFTLNNLLRFEGRASLSMVGLMTGAILNIALDPLFMFGLNMGIAGAGLSTALSQVVSFFILLFMFLSGKAQIKLSLKRFTKNAAEILDIFGTGFPSFIRQGLTSISTMLMNNCAAIYGDAAVAAMSIVGRINMFIFSFAIGIGQGFQPVSAFNYGAKKYSRVKKAFFFTLTLCEIAIVIVSFFIMVFAGEFISIFRDDYEVIRIGTVALRMSGVGLLCNPLCLMANMCLQSTGQKTLAAFVSMLRSGLYFIPVLLIMSRILGLTGVQISQPLADVLSFITSLPILIRYLNNMPEDENEI